MNTPVNEMPTVEYSEDELARALDRVIAARQTGQPLDRSSLLSRFPQLAEALAALDQLCHPSPEELEKKPESRPATLPERIGPYEIERELGSGGFGIVYKAFDPVLQRPVALKVLHAGRLDDGEVEARFQREARATAKLRHLGVVQLHDYSRDGAPFFLATEYIEGVDLKTWCMERKAPLPDIANLVAFVAEAIEHAHSHGICHRDLKPANILVDAKGDPHVLDFGLALLRADDSLGQHTGGGKILGTLSYMAPEQAAGHSHDADARSDVYSLGVILYELITERLPFLGPSHSLPASVIEGSKPRPRDLNPAIPRELEAICLKAMAKRPEDRYQSAAGFARDLRAYLRGDAVEAQPYTWMHRVYNVLTRRHQDTLAHDWSLVLVLEGTAILIGCSLVHFFQEVWPVTQKMWLPIYLTKATQIAVMLGILFRLRPSPESGPTAVERQVRVLVPAYFCGCLAIIAVRHYLGMGLSSVQEPLPLEPFLAVLSGMVFVNLGTTIWGWFYLWGAAFCALAVLIANHPHVGQLLLGIGWFVCLAANSVHLRHTR